MVDGAVGADAEDVDGPASQTGLTTVPDTVAVEVVELAAALAGVLEVSKVVIRVYLARSQRHFMYVIATVSLTG